MRNLPWSEVTPVHGTARHSRSTESESVTRSVLLIDDDPDVLRSIARILERHRYRVHCAGSGEEGVKMWQLHRPDVTLCDLVLPGMNGMAVLEHLKTRHAIVIVFSGHGDIADAVNAMRHGAETFLTKPIELEHLLQAVDRAAEKAHLTKLVQDLRTRPTGFFQARHAKLILMIVAAALVVGLAIGKGWEYDRSPLAPVPEFGTLNGRGARP